MRRRLRWGGDSSGGEGGVGEGGGVGGGQAQGDDGKGGGVGSGRTFLSGSMPDFAIVEAASQEVAPDSATF